MKSLLLASALLSSIAASATTIKYDCGQRYETPVTLKFILAETTKGVLVAPRVGTTIENNVKTVFIGMPDLVEVDGRDMGATFGKKKFYQMMNIDNAYALMIEDQMTVSETAMVVEIDMQKADNYHVHKCLVKSVE